MVRLRKGTKNGPKQCMISKFLQSKRTLRPSNVNFQMSVTLRTYRFKSNLRILVSKLGYKWVHGLQ